MGGEMALETRLEVGDLPFMVFYLPCTSSMYLEYHAVFGTNRTPFVPCVEKKKIFYCYNN